MKADVVVIGGGHNALVAAAYLAKGGLKPVVLERRGIVGGAAVTEEFHPGFKASTVAHTAGPLRASVVRDLGLTLQLVEPEPRVFVPLADGRGLQLFGDPARSAAEIGRFSTKDAARYPEFHNCLGRLAKIIGRVLGATPPDIATPAMGDVLPLLRVALGVRGLGRVEAQNLLRWGPMAVADFAAEWFETEALRAVIAARGITGAFAGPWSAGTTAQLLLTSAASGGNGAGSTVLVKGGLGALTEALAAAAKRFGAEVRVGAEVERITAKDGKVSGVVLKGGEEIATRAVVSGIHPQTTFLRLLDPALLDPEDLGRMRNYQTKGMASKVNLAVSNLPSFAALKGQDEQAALRGRIHIGPSIDDIERAYDDGKHGDISKKPYMDVTIPTLSDPGFGPAGSHVVSVYAQYTPHRLKTGSWDTRREEVGDVVVRTLEAYAPGFASSVVGRQVLTPVDLERTYGLVGGHPLHGDPSINQLFTMRPLLGFARYRGGLDGLYLCSAGSHPGGGVTGGPGANAAREILKDLR
ncbi:MAG: phytoene desaturase family protein [Vicinamibacteria bacterium]